MVCVDPFTLALAMASATAFSSKGTPFTVMLVGPFLLVVTVRVVDEAAVPGASKTAPNEPDREASALPAVATVWLVRVAGEVVLNLLITGIPVMLSFWPVMFLGSRAYVALVTGSVMVMLSGVSRRVRPWLSR